MTDSYVVSAPGKVILFGEHSVVHGHPAIAAAVSLRTYLLVTDPKQDGYITLNFPDTKLEKSWKVEDLPFSDSEEISNVSDVLDQALVEKLKPHLEGMENTFQHVAAFAFLYLYCTMCSKATPAYTYAAKSVLPIGAGLGSSASLSVCLAGGLLKAAGHGDRADAAELINSWSFLGERCIHGNPSGIDNAVATRGGAVFFQREPKIVEVLEFPPLKLLLTNTAVPRRTSELVSGVGELKNRIPLVSEPIMQAMGEVSREAYKILKENNQIGPKLAELARINHGLLVSIGVSHSSLEKVKSAADDLGIGQTKLTGAGGGGCAITIVSNEEEHSSEHVKKFESAIPEGFEVFETVLGGDGVGYTNVEKIPVDEFLKINNGDQYDKLGQWVYWN